MMEKDVEEAREEWRRGGIEDGRRRGELSCREDFVFCLISCPFPLPFRHPPIQ